MTVIFSIKSNKIVYMNEVMKWAEDLITEFGNSSDLIRISPIFAGVQAEILFVDGLTEKQLMTDSLLTPMSEIDTLIPPYMDDLRKKLRPVYPISTIEQSQTIKDMANGRVLMRLEGSEEIFSIDLISFKVRSIVEPPTASVLKGPREGFIEDMKINLSLMRRRLKTNKFHVVSGTVGRLTNTAYSIVYIEGIADEELVQSVAEKIDSFEIDGIVDSSYIAKLLEKNENSPFKLVGTTEKPDILTAKLLEGRIGIIVDGSPLVLTLPFIMVEDFQDSQDYFRKTSRATLNRLLRLAGVAMAVLLPAFFVAVQEFQYEMLPIKFMLTIINVTSGIPLTPTLEMLVVIVIFEVLNEASVRMPRYVGMALSVVGAIVLGDTAVKAGLISSPAVLISALSSTGLYCVPDQNGAFSILRLALVCAAGVLGLYGLVLSLFVVMVYLLSLESYGTPYLAPFAPLIPSDIKDTFIKASLMKMNSRPMSILHKKQRRMKDE